MSAASSVSLASTDRRQHRHPRIVAEDAADLRAELGVGEHQPRAVYAGLRTGQPTSAARPARSTTPPGSPRRSAQPDDRCAQRVGSEPERLMSIQWRVWCHGVVGSTGCGSGGCGVCGGWLVWMALRLVWKLTASSPSRHSVPTLW